MPYTFFYRRKVYILLWLMTSKHFLRFASILRFFREEEKLVSRGENAMESNHVKNMIFDRDLLIIRGNIHASMKDRIYEVEIYIDDEKEIQHATCSCPRGQLICHHMAALVIFAYHNISITDVTCSWSAKKPTDDKTQTIDDIYNSKGHSSLKVPISQESVLNLKRKLGTFQNAVGYTWLLRDEPPLLKRILPDIEEIVFSDNYIKAENKISFVKNCLALTEEQVKAVTTKTIGQSSNEEWLIARKNRLTSSNFGPVLSAVKRNKFPSSLFKRLTESYTLDGIKAIQWGKEHEANGISVLEQNKNVHVIRTGLWLDSCGFIGGSPDGLIGEDYIVEIKCPYKYRKSTSLKDDVKDKKYIIYFNEQQECEINENHDYYQQIQGNLFFTKRKTCYVVIWTPNETIIFDIERNEKWGHNLHLLKYFYLNKYIPFLCGN